MPRPILDIHAKFWPKINIGTTTECWEWAGYKTKCGYGRMFVDHKTVYAHRLSYSLRYGNIPDGFEIDHICNNRGCVNPSHLRLASYGKNQKNASLRKDNTSRFKGVSFYKRDGSWRAQISINGTPTHLGYFPTPGLAHAAYCEAAVKYHGEFANFG